MKSKDIAYILLRFLSIYIFILALINFSQVINYSILTNLGTFKDLGINSNGAILSLFFGSIAPSVLLVLISIILWIYTDKIANYLVPKNTSNESESKFNLEDIQYLAFSVVGLILISNTLPQVFNLIPQIIQLNEISSYLATEQLKSELFFSVIGIGVKLLIGFLLLFSNKIKRSLILIGK